MSISTGLLIRESATIELPVSINRVMLGLLPLLPGQHMEYGLYLQGTWLPESLTVRVDPAAVYLPRQTVSVGSIHFTEDPPGPEWNVVIHRHPQGMRVFSGVDRDSINEEFLASILFIPPFDFPAAVVNVPIALGVKLQTKAVILPQGTLFEIADDLRVLARENIKREVPSTRGKPLNFAQDPTLYPRGKVTRVGKGTIETVGNSIPHPSHVRQDYPAISRLDGRRGNERTLPKENDDLIFDHIRNVFNGTGIDDGNVY
jgi:hypothetical protein